jgi:hypothetical protein
LWQSLEKRVADATLATKIASFEYEKFTTVHLRVVSGTAGKQAVPMSLVSVTLNHVIFSNISLDS